MATKGKLIELGTHNKMTVEEALGACLRMNLGCVMIVGYDQNDALVIQTSEMVNKEALWLAEKAKRHALGDDNE